MLPSRAVPLPIAKLENPIQPYAWGSREAIARLQGRPCPSPTPEAEIWIGDHPVAPSRVVGDGEKLPLSDWIARDRASALGPDHRDLPFLTKVLAAGRSLSVQVHPDAARACQGFARENAAGVPDDRRSYRDSNAKHEVLVALSPFEALCGFREDASVAGAIAAVPSLAQASLPPGPGPLALRLLHGLQRLDTAARARLLAELAVFAEGDSRDAKICRQLLDEHPGDPLACAPMLLNAVHLAPGEALIVRPGTVHAYLQGSGVEVMTRSDNVVRAGLTPKHVDADELLAVTAARTGDDEIQRPPADPSRPGESSYETGTDVFSLCALDLAASPLRRPGGHVTVVLCVEGGVRLDELPASGRATVELGAGEAALVPARVEAFQLTRTARTSRVFEVSAR